MPCLYDGINPVCVHGITRCLYTHTHIYIYIYIYKRVLYVLKLLSEHYGIYGITLPIYCIFLYIENNLRGWIKCYFPNVRRSETANFLEYYYMISGCMNYASRFNPEESNVTQIKIRFCLNNYYLLK